MIPTVPERLAAMENTLIRIDHTINGNGQPGMAQRLEKYITKQCLQENALEIHIAGHSERKMDWKWAVTALIAVGSVVVAVVK